MSDCVYIQHVEPNLFVAGWRAIVTFSSDFKIVKMSEYSIDLK